MNEIYRCVIGSQAYGLETEDSDVDIRTVFVAPTESLVGIGKFRPHEHYEKSEPDEQGWEIGKYFEMALHCNPNILETLWTPIVVSTTEVWQQINCIRELFISMRVAKTYGGYAQSQLEKINRKENARVRNKHAMHLIRLMIAGINVLESGEVLVDMRQFRDKLLLIKHGGDAGLQEALTWYKYLKEEFDKSEAKRRLPEDPDYETVNNVLLDIRSRYWKNQND